MKKAAVEWLHYVSKQRELDKFDWEQAKEMEKQQIVDAYDKGEFNQGCNGDAEQYYKETFKKD